MILLPPIEDCTEEHSTKPEGHYRSPDYIKTNFLSRDQDIYSLGFTLLQVFFNTMLGHTNSSPVRAAHCYATHAAYAFLHSLSDERKLQVYYNFVNIFAKLRNITFNNSDRELLVYSTFRFTQKVWMINKKNKKFTYKKEVSKANDIEIVWYLDKRKSLRFITLIKYPMHICCCSSTATFQ